MSNYTGLLTGNYYFQLNTGDGFIEATNNDIIKVPPNDYNYAHGLKRKLVDNSLKWII